MLGSWQGVNGKKKLRNPVVEVSCGRLEDVNRSWVSNINLLCCGDFVQVELKTNVLAHFLKEGFIICSSFLASIISRL